MKRYIKSAVADVSDEDMDSRKEIAKSTTDNVELLKKLAKDSSRKVRERVAKNTNTPIEVLAQLSKDKSYLVRLGVIKNRSVTPELLSDMVKAELPKCKGWDPSSHLEVPAELFKNSKTPLEWRLKLLHTPVMQHLTYVREAVAKNKKTPVDLLIELANDYRDGVQECVASNPSTPLTVLKQLHSLQKFVVDFGLTKNPNTPTDILYDIYKKYSYEDFRDNILKHRNFKGDFKDRVTSELAEQKKRNTLATYVGKDVWIAAESYGISRDYDVYIRLVKKASNKNEYVINEVYDDYKYDYKYDYSFDESEEDYNAKVQMLKEDMQETSTQIIEKYDSSDSGDADIVVYSDFETYTTEELIKKLCGEYEE